MDRRDFLKLFALSAAGIYIPKRSYFFMPQTQLRTIEVPVYGSPTAFYMPNNEDWAMIPQSRFDSVIVKLMVDVKTQIIKSYEIPPQLVGNVTKGQLERAMDRMLYQRGMNLNE